MNIIENDFKNRIKELILLLREIRDNEKNKAKKEINPILKGAVYLFLYNVVESILRNLLSVTNREVVNSNVDFDDLNESLRSYIYSSFNESIFKDSNYSNRKNKIDKKLKQKTLSSSLLDFLYEDPFLPALNLAKIKKIMNYYGLVNNVDLKDEVYKHFFDQIESKRHSLAHGHESFYDVGKNKVFRELFSDSYYTIKALRIIVKSYIAYLKNNQYLK